MMTFAVGEKVVYPNQGVGTIENISTRYFEQKPEKFYLLRLFCSSMTVMVPFTNAETIGLRKLSKNTEVTKVLTYLAGPGVESLRIGRFASRSTARRCSPAAFFRSRKFSSNWFDCRPKNRCHSAKKRCSTARALC